MFTLHLHTRLHLPNNGANHQQIILSHRLSNWSFWCIECIESYEETIAKDKENFHLWNSRMLFGENPKQFTIIFHEPSVKLVKIDMTGTLKRATTRELNHINWIEKAYETLFRCILISFLAVSYNICVPVWGQKNWSYVGIFPNVFEKKKKMQN